MSNGGTGRPAATLMRALSGWTLLSLSEAQCVWCERADCGPPIAQASAGAVAVPCSRDTGETNDGLTNMVEIQYYVVKGMWSDRN